MLQAVLDLAGQHIDLHNAVDLISEELHADRRLPTVCRKDLQDISMHPEGTTVKIHIVSCVLDINKLADHIITIPLHTRTQRHHHSQEVFRAAQAVNTGNRGNHHHIPPFHQRRCRRQTQLVNLLIDRRIFRNVSVRRRNIRLRLIVIVIGNEILDRIFREEFLHLPIKLCRERLVV